MRFRTKRKKPISLDLEAARDRVLVLQAYHTLLSRGMDEDDAKREAARYVLENWDEVTGQ